MTKQKIMKGFIEVHPVEDEENRVLINVKNIRHISENRIYFFDSDDKCDCLEVTEKYEQLKLKLEITQQ